MANLPKPVIKQLKDFLSTGSVFVVEPSENYRTTIRRYMENLGIKNVKFLNSAADAITELRAASVSLVICEWKLQKGQLNGLQFCRELRNDERLWETPFLLISVESLRRDIVLASEVGVDGYLLKPFSYEDFCEQLLTVIKTWTDRVKFAKMLNQAEALLKEGSYDKAKSLFTECQEYKQGSSRVLCGLGQICVVEKDLKQAAEQYMAALEINPSYIEAYRLLLDIYEEGDDAHRILHFALKAHELSPDNPRYLLLLAKSYLVIGELNESELFFRRVIRISPKMAEGHKGLGDIHMLREDYEQAMKNYQKALDLDGKDVSILNSMGLVYVKKEDFKKGLKHYELALNIEPNNAKVLFNLGYAYEKLDDLATAKSFFNKALISDPDFEKPKRAIERIDRILKAAS